MRWRELVVAAALAVGLAGCITSEPVADSGLAMATPSAEAAAIAAAEGRVQRDGPQLTITLGKGGTIQFTDYHGHQQAGKDWDSVTHLYRGRLGEGRYHLVERSAYGRIHDVLIEANNGASWSVPGSAHISPNADRLLILPDEAGSKRLQIWALVGVRPKVEIDIQPNRPVRFDSWPEDDRISLRIPDQGTMKTVWLERVWGAWDLPMPIR